MNDTSAPERIEPEQAIDALIKLPEVCRQAGLGKTAIYEMIAAGTFPEPIKLGCASRWSQLEVQAWIGKQKASRRPQIDGAEDEAA
ncbi:helix-turn-helix transcriptional regulator [Azotobacter vinelandii]|uniref:helix-turn-helix transcriptional regulator n=1 Tax=Azotobacter vinelandii TaxID=354 RepID=UPI00266638A3|nr:AlpA family phage regulatory protein [Azotobacter vinelandii]WKN21521.1 AlpA family phage regulatory protein [Azotobacter vinelandii]